MQKKSEINLNEHPSIQESSSENNSMEQQQQQQQQQRENLDTDVVESGSDAMVVNSNENNRLIQTESSLPEENQAAANRERRERILWKEEEHRLFLQGLNKHGRGRWKDISKEFVPGKNPTQIASHAQKYFKHQNEVAGKQRKKRRSIHDITVDNNGTSVTLAIEPQIEIPLIEQQNERPPLISPSIEQQLEIPSTEQQNENISPLVTHAIEQQNENISPHSTTLKDNNSDNLVTPSIEPFQQRQGLQLEYNYTFEITPRNMKNVVKVCELLEKALKEKE